jgi:hypothetical protein
VGPTYQSPSVRTGPACQCAVTAWLPCAALHHALKALSRPRMSDPTAARLPTTLPTSPRLASRVSVPIATHLLTMLPMLPHLASRAPVPTTLSEPPHRRCRPPVGAEQRRTPSSATPARWSGVAWSVKLWAAAVKLRAVSRPHAWAAARATLGRGRIRPMTLLYFFIFWIPSNQCKFKNLCRIHLNSENYETNFVE